MKVGIAQVNPCVGDLEGNVAACVAAAERAAAAGADLVAFPELVIPGYSPRDMLLDDSFVDAVLEATADLARRLWGAPPVVVGTICRADHRPPRHPGLHNAAAWLVDGEVRQLAPKRLLPAYDVFHEARWFLPGPPTPPFQVAGRRVGTLVCEDLWDEGYRIHPSADLVAAGADLLVSMSASPFRPGVMEERIHQARRSGCAGVHVNLCGATDELIFDGRSFAVDRCGEVIAVLAAFAEEVRVVDIEGAPTVEVASDPLRELHGALVLGIRDFARKNGLRRAFLGLSGGIDSALVARLAADALGPESVTAVAMPSRFTAESSTADARELAGRLGIGFDVVPLERLHAAAEATLEPLLAGDDAAGTTAENIQARLRALILMAFVNRHGGMLLNTSNKTEVSLGYGTLYGDLAGSLCPIADLTKLQVIELARWLGGFPEGILRRPPSAELRPDQVDPFDYDRVAPAMEELVAADRSDGAMRRAEHKRWQLGVVLKVSKRAFGSGRLIPITRR